MYELIQVGENTFTMDCPAKVGFYRIAGDRVVLIDSGSDKDAGKKVKKILDANGWKCEAIFNTHSHADHIGGNQYLQSQTGCKIYAYGIEQSFVSDPVLEPMMLYGGYPMTELRNKFLMAKESKAEPMTPEVLPEGLSMIELFGHSPSMVGFRTSDDVVFLADCVASEETLAKYAIGYLYDVKQHLLTLERVLTMNASCFVPSHAAVRTDVKALVQRNIDVTKQIAETIVELLAEEKTFDELLSEVFTTFALTMNLTQNVLVGSTVRSYLAYLKEEGKVTCRFFENRMLWKAGSV